MRSSTKVRVTITLSRDVLSHVDKRARSGSARSRSAFIEEALRELMRHSAEAMIARETIAYYQSLSQTEEAEDAALAQALGAASRRVAVDRPQRGKGRKPKR